MIHIIKKIFIISHKKGKRTISFQTMKFNRIIQYFAYNAKATYKA